MKIRHLLKAWFYNDLGLREVGSLFSDRCSCCFTTVAYLACSINVLSNVLFILKGIIYKQSILQRGITVVHCNIGRKETPTTFHWVCVFFLLN